MQAHHVLLALGGRLIERYQVGARPGQSLGLRAVVLGQHVVLIIQPFAVFDRGLIGYHHPHFLVRRQVFQVVGHCDALGPARAPHPSCGARHRSGGPSSR